MHKWTDNLRTSLAAPKKEPKRSPSREGLQAFGQCLDKKRHKRRERKSSTTRRSWLSEEIADDSKQTKSHILRAESPKRAAQVHRWLHG